MTGRWRGAGGRGCLVSKNALFYNLRRSAGTADAELIVELTSRRHIVEGESMKRVRFVGRGRSIGLVVAVVAVATATLAGASAAGAASSKITKGGNITVLQTTDPGSLDPSKMGVLSTSGPIGYPVYDQLLTFDSKTGKLKPILLQSITGNADSTVWTLKLRPNVKFADGTTLDSSAIKANFDYALASTTSSAKSTAAQIASWDISDPLVAKITLNAANSVYPLEIVNRISMIASPTALTKFGTSYGTSPETTVGAGPFTLQSYTRGSQIVYARNPNYWNAPQPYLDTLTIKFIADPNTAYQTVQTGGADMFFSGAANQQLIDQAKAAGMKFFQIYPANVTPHPIYFMNLARAPFNDLTARQAMYACLDPKKVAAAAGLQVATAIFDKTSPWYSANGAFPAFDAKKCQDLINQWSAKNGNAPLTFTVTDIVGNNTLGGQGQTIQAIFAAYQNVKVNVQQVTNAQLTPLGPAGNFDLYPSAVGGIDPTQAYDTAYPTNAARNFGKYSNPQMDAAITSGHSTTNQTQRKAAYDTVQKLLVTDLPTWFMPIVTFPANYWVINNKSIQNFDSGQWTGPMAQVWIKQGK
jgi:peptide/nickel transport system substrate-binding protein